MEDDINFEGMLCMCDDYERGLTQYSNAENHKSSPKMVTIWLHPLKGLTDVDIQIFVWKCSYVNRKQCWYFEDLEVKAGQRKQGNAILNACK